MLSNDLRRYLQRKVCNNCMSAAIDACDTCKVRTLPRRAEWLEKGLADAIRVLEREDDPLKLREAYYILRGLRDDEPPEEQFWSV